MSSLFEQLWPAFVEEVSEQLETLELELLKTDIDSIDVRQLFRQFHTIKSSCGMLEFASMEAIAHVAEDILGEVREGNTQLTPELVSALVKAIDALKAQMAEAEKTKQAPASQDDIVLKLKAIYVKLTGETEQESDFEAPEQNEDTGATKKAVASNGLQINPELEALSIIIQDHLQNIVSKKSKKNQARILESINQVKEACEALGYKSISMILAKLEQEYIKEDSNEFYVISYISDLLARIETVENSFVVDLGSKECRKLVSKLYRKDFIKAVEDYVHELTLIADFSEGDDLSVWSKGTLNNTFHLINYSRLFAIGEFTEYLNVSYQLLKKLIYGKSSIDELKQLSASIHQALNHQEFDKDVKRFLDYTEQHIEGKQIQASEPKVLESVDDLKHLMLIDWSQFLSASKLRELSACYQQGIVLRELFVDFDYNKQASERFVNWLYEHTDVLTNISVFAEDNLEINVKASVAFLVIDHEADLNESELDAIDIDEQFIHHFSYRKQLSNQTETKANVRADSQQRKTESVKRSAREQSTLRISSQQLDRFVSQVGELVMASNSMAHAIYDESFMHNLLKMKAWLREHASQLETDDMSLFNEVLDGVSDYREHLIQNDLRVQGTISRIQDEALGLRVVPISGIFNRLPRLVHSLNHDLGKQVVLEVHGENEKIDKSLVDILMEPMLHLVRNAVDHGIESPEQRKQAGKPEQGRLSIEASTLGSTVIIEVKDDGKGLDREKIIAKAKKLGLDYDPKHVEELIFAPGFSTSDTLTETSGRGVGLDAVKASIVNIGGNVEVESQFGKGCTFILSVPVSVAIQGVVLVESAIQRFAIPERNVEEVVSFDVHKIQQLNGQASYLLRDEVLPVFDLNRLIFPSQSETLVQDYKEASFLVLSNGKERMALVVSEVLGRQEIFVRDVNPGLLNIPGFGGASVLGDGKVVIILDSESLMQLAENNAQAQQTFIRQVLQ